MQDLKLIGVHEDGMHLVLGDQKGHRFSLPLDEALRSAARRDHPGAGQLALDLHAPLRPKDVQAMVRAGLSTEEVAERAGWTVEKVHRYEGPILAEREHVARLATEVRLRGRGISHGAAPTLGERVADRLRSREIDASSATWDSRRADRGSWTVLLSFDAGGRRRQAAWDFDLLARTVVARDDEARWLSEDEAIEAPGPIPAPHLLSSRPTRLYDVEAEGGIGLPARSREDETVDLMAAMRERSAQRGRRRRTKVSDVPGLDRAPVEALPLAELAGDPSVAGSPPAAHPHPADDPSVRHGAVPSPAGRRPGPADQATSRMTDQTPQELEPDGAHEQASARTAERTGGSASGATLEDTEAADDVGASDRSSMDRGLPRRGRAAGQAGRRATEPMPVAPQGTGRAEGAPERAADHGSDHGADHGAERESGTDAYLDPDSSVDVNDTDVVAGADTDADADVDTDADTPSVAEPARRTGTDAARPHAGPPLRPAAGAALTRPGAAAKPAPTRKSGRPSVPSWDDIVFGRKPD